MAATATTDIINALKYAYGVNKVQYLFNQESPTWAMLSKVKKPMGGRGQFIMPAATKNAGAFTGIAEGGALPTALQPATTEATFSLHEYVGMYDMSWKLIQDSATDKFAFQQALQFLEDGLKRRIFRNLNSDLLDDGRGRLAVMTIADNATPVTVTALPRLEVGMSVACMATADDDTRRDTGGATPLTVTGVTPDTRSVAFSGTIGSTAAGDYFVIHNGVASTTDVSVSTRPYHAMGLLGAINNADPLGYFTNQKFGQITRATAGNEFWQSMVLSNGGTNRPLTEDILLQAMDGQREKGGQVVNAWLSNLAIVRRYHEILAGERYFALSKPGVMSGGIGRSNEGMGVKGSDGKPNDSGLTPYEFSGVPWYVDPYFNANTIIGLNTDHFFLGVGENDVPRPISEIFDNASFFRQTTSATFEVCWYYQMELLSDNPAAGVQIKDIAEA